VGECKPLTDGIQKDHNYLFRLHIALRNYEQAAGPLGTLIMTSYCVNHPVDWPST
jgi:hypothetical protein